MNPAQKIIEKFGTAKIIADGIGVKVEAVYKWTYPRERSGTDGFIPVGQQVKVINLAKKLGVELKAEDFFEDGVFDQEAPNS